MHLIISGDELFSETLPHSIVDGCMYQVEGKYVTESDEQYGFSENEEGDETANVINVIHTHKLQPYSITKKDYTTWFKGYSAKLYKHLKEKNPERAEDFQKQVQAFIKKIIGTFTEYDHYIGVSFLINFILFK